MWGDQYEIVVTTHLNTDSLHNHFIINSVSFKTGRKYENHIRDHIRLREISDHICREHALRLLLLGPEYDQTVLKTEKAAAHLRFLGADELSAAELSAFREAVAREERAYQEVFAGTLSKLLEED